MCWRAMAPLSRTSAFGCAMLCTSFKHRCRQNAVLIDGFSIGDLVFAAVRRQPHRRRGRGGLHMPSVSAEAAAGRNCHRTSSYTCGPGHPSVNCHRRLRPQVPPTEAVISARCGELLNGFVSTLLADLRLLAAADADTFHDQRRCHSLLRFYSEVMRRPVCFLTRTLCWTERRASKPSSASHWVAMDAAGAGIASARRRTAGGAMDRAPEATTASVQLAAPDLLAVAFRANKKALLWDCLLANEPL